MAGLLGEYECKIDSKGRMRLPSPLLKQLEAEGATAFVINRGLEKCLMLYPRKVWDRIEEDVNQLNMFVEENREFVRFMYRGANEITPDGQDRILLSKRLMEFAGMTKDTVVFCQNDRMEIWDADTFYKIEDSKKPADFSKLAQKVSPRFGKPIPKEEEKKDDL